MDWSMYCIIVYIGGGETNTCFWWFSKGVPLENDHFIGNSALNNAGMIRLESSALGGHVFQAFWKSDTVTIGIYRLINADESDKRKGWKICGWSKQRCWLTGEGGGCGGTVHRYKTILIFSQTIPPHPPTLHFSVPYPFLPSIWASITLLTRPIHYFPPPPPSRNR